MGWAGVSGGRAIRLGGRWVACLGAVNRDVGGRGGGWVAGAGALEAVSADGENGVRAGGGS